LVGVGDLTLKTACRVAGNFPDVAELKIHAGILQPRPRAVPVTKQPQNRRLTGTILVADQVSRLRLCAADDNHHAEGEQGTGPQAKGDWCRARIRM